MIVALVASHWVPSLAISTSRVIISLKADSNELMFAIPGGLIAVGTKVDPQFTKKDMMVGGVVGHPDKMPEVYNVIDVTTTILKRIVGAKSDQKTL